MNKIPSALFPFYINFKNSGIKISPIGLYCLINLPVGSCFHKSRLIVHTCKTFHYKKINKYLECCTFLTSPNIC